MSSFAIFSMFAFAPIFLQGAQRRSPLEVGMAMLSLSLAWSLGSLTLGRIVNRLGRKSAALLGATGLLTGCGMTLTFTMKTTGYYTFTSFFVIGLGMGFVALSTLLVVQSSLERKNLGVATSANQFARTLGGAVGVGICGSIIANRLSGLVETVQNSGFMDRMPETLTEAGGGRIESLFRPEVQSALPADLRQLVQENVAGVVMEVFWVGTLAAFLCLLFCLLIPGKETSSGRRAHRD